MQKNNASVINLVFLGFLFSSISLAQAQEKPTDEMLKVLDKDKHREICGASNQLVIHNALLMNLSREYNLNLFSMSDLRGILGVSPDATMDTVVATWLTSEYEKITASLPGTNRKLSDSDVDQILNSVQGLAAYLRAEISGNFPADLGFDVTVMGSNVDLEQSDHALLKLLFQPEINGGAGQVSLRCISVTGTAAKPSTTTKPAKAAKPTEDSKDEDSSGVVWALRGDIDDISIPRAQRALFNRASSATVSFTNNFEQGNETFNIDAVLGLGRRISSQDHAFIFIGYENNSTQTADPDDDESTNETSALSPGFLFSRSVFSTTPSAGDDSSFDFAATVGASVYPTFDFDQDSTSLKARVYLNDIAFSLPNSSAGFCGRELPILSNTFTFDCRLRAFADFGHVFDAGTNIDFQTIEDDEYFGLGGGATAIFSFSDKISFLDPFSLRASYSYLGIVSGALTDAEEFTVELGYTIPSSNIQFGLSYQNGESFDTFLEREIFSVSAGLKF